MQETSLSIETNLQKRIAELEEENAKLKHDFKLLYCWAIFLFFTIGALYGENILIHDSSVYTVLNRYHLALVAAFLLAVLGNAFVAQKLASKKDKKLNRFGLKTWLILIIVPFVVIGLGFLI